MSNKEDICIGTILDAHGIQGAVRARVYSDEPQELLKYKYFKDKQGRLFHPKTLRVLKGDTVAIKFEEFNDRSAAEALKKLDLFIAHQQLPTLEEDDFYISDLIGLQVKTEAGKLIGKVTAVENHGAGAFLTISSTPINCVPFIRDAVPTVCLDEGYIVVSTDYLDQDIEALINE